MVGGGRGLGFGGVEFFFDTRRGGVRVEGDGNVVRSRRGFAEAEVGLWSVTFVPGGPCSLGPRRLGGPRRLPPALLLTALN
jgi:hypothetical protein